MARQERRSGRGRRSRDRRGGSGAAPTEEIKNAAPKRRLKLERRSGLDRRSIGPLDAILKGRDES